MATVEEKTAPPKGGKLKWLVLLLLIGLFATAGGFATPMVLKKFADKGNEKTPDPRGGQNLRFAFIPFDTVVVNVNEASLSRFLRVKFNVVVDEASEEEVNKAIQDNKAVLKNWLISHLSDKGMQDVQGAAAIHRARREILDQFNTLLFPDGSEKIRDILFEEFNTQ
jgi:flagellar basal body-associated protein FliL